MLGSLQPSFRLKAGMTEAICFRQLEPLCTVLPPTKKARGKPRLFLSNGCVGELPLLAHLFKPRKPGADDHALDVTAEGGGVDDFGEGLNGHDDLIHIALQVLI